MSSSSDYAHHFSTQNIPFGIASSTDHPSPAVVTRIENHVIFLSQLAETILSPVINDEGISSACLAKSTLNEFAALPRSHHQKIRHLIREAYESSGGISAFPNDSFQHVNDVRMHMPVYVGDFTDFSCSLDHVQNAGRLVVNNARPPPAFFNFPIGYEGRGSSVVVSGTEIQRPWGQYRSHTADGSPTIIYNPSSAVDYEVELGAIIGRPLPMRQKLTADQAEDHIFGFVLLNDWSARDIQGLEMIPLGPLNGKNLGTSISPWIITLDALEPFQIPSPSKPNPTDFSFPDLPLPEYLHDSRDTTYPIHLKVEVAPSSSLMGKEKEKEGEGEEREMILTGTCKFESLYWNHRHMVSHLVSAGAGLRTGDIVATGTISGGGQAEKGCLLEATEGGKVPLEVTTSSSSSSSSCDGGDGSTKIGYLRDGDRVRITGFVAGEGSGVGFGECVGRVVA